MLQHILLTLGLTTLFTAGGLTVNTLWHAERPQGETQQVETVSATPATTLSVVITGAVQQPGVYQVPAYGQLKDLVALAGGLSPEAQSMPEGYWQQPLYGGQIVHVAAQPGTASLVQRVSHTQKAPRVTGKIKKRSSHQTPLRQAPQQKINLNTADAKTLTTLPGVGPALAKRILEARKAKPFAKPEDLIERVKGIGPAKFKKMADWVQ